MTIYTQVVRQVKKMSQTEKIALLKVLADSLDQEAPKARRKHTLKSLYGALRPKDGRVPSDDELKRDYSSYLTEKYK